MAVAKALGHGLDQSWLEAFMHFDDQVNVFEGWILMRVQKFCLGSFDVTNHQGLGPRVFF